jgi:hypothetical protein
LEAEKIAGKSFASLRREVFFPEKTYQDRLSTRAKKQPVIFLQSFLPDRFPFVLPS